MYEEYEYDGQVYVQLELDDGVGEVTVVSVGPVSVSVETELV